MSRQICIKFILVKIFNYEIITNYYKIKLLNFLTYVICNENIFCSIETINIFVSVGVVWSCRFKTDSQTSYHHIF